MRRGVSLAATIDMCFRKDTVLHPCSDGLGIAAAFSPAVATAAMAVSSTLGGIAAVVIGKAAITNKNYFHKPHRHL
jgi:hypothetical protein